MLELSAKYILLTSEEPSAGTRSTPGMCLFGLGTKEEVVCCVVVLAQEWRNAREDGEDAKEGLATQATITETSRERLMQRLFLRILPSPRRVLRIARIMQAKGLDERP